MPPSRKIYNLNTAIRLSQRIYNYEQKSSKEMTERNLSLYIYIRKFTKIPPVVQFKYSLIGIYTVRYNLLKSTMYRLRESYEEETK